MTATNAARGQFSYTTNPDGISATITGYNGLGGTVIIPTNINNLTVTSIGMNAFGGNYRLTNVTILNSVISIGTNAFRSCENLTNISIGNSVTSISEYAFYFDTGLTSISVPNSVINIADNAFSECRYLSTITLGTNLTSIGEDAFFESGLTNVDIPNSVTNIADYAFSSCPYLATATFGTNLISIGDGAFDSEIPLGTDPLQTITIPNSVITIGNLAFDGCAYLQSVSIGSGVISIGSSAFSMCALSSVVIPNSVIRIGDGAFSECANLQNIIIPNSVTSIGGGAFGSCSSLTNAVIGKNVSTISGGAFANCTSLTGIYFEGNAPVADVSVFDGEPNAIVYYTLGTTGWGLTFADLLTEIWNVETPVITVQPQPEMTRAHAAASFQVAAVGSGLLSYQWLQNGTNIPGAISSSLTIPNVTQTNLGTYSVVVTNDFGSVTSSGATLEMYPFIAVPFTGAIIYWGQTATLGVVVWGTGQLSYQWFQNGVALPGQTNPIMTLSNIQFTDAGLYSVVVTNPLGSVTNIPEQVVVEPAGVSLGFCPALTISGVPGYSYTIQSSTNLANSAAWLTLTNLTLTVPVQIWVDTSVDASSPFNSKNFYRVLTGQ